MTIAEMIGEFPKTTCLLAQNGHRYLRLLHTGDQFRVTYSDNDRQERKYKFMKILVETGIFKDAFEVWEKNARELIYNN